LELHSILAGEMPKRSLLLLAIGALGGLALSGYALFTAPGSTTDQIPLGAIARVNQRQILLSDYSAQLQNLYGVPLEKASPAQRKAVLDSMISEELLVQRGLEIDLPATDPAVREALVAGVELTSSADIEARKPGDEALRAWFAVHQSQYASNGWMLLHDLVLPLAQGQSAEARFKTAGQAAQALGEGMVLRNAQARFGLKASSSLGVEEQIDIAVARVLGPELFEVARSLGAGEVSNPIALPDGIHVLVMEKRRREVPLAFDAVRDRVASDLKREAIDKARAEYVRFLRAKAEVLLAPGYGE
jgi:hypothetical protein